jgi:hypothetical protein
MKINWNLFLANQLTNLLQDAIVFLAQPLAGDKRSLRFKFTTECEVATGRVLATLKKETLQHSALAWC